MVIAETLRSDVVPISRVEVAVFRIPTDFPESDGTFEWDSTTLVIVELFGADLSGIGFTYADTATATLIRDRLADLVLRRNALDIESIWSAMLRSIRNLGRPGIAAMAISAVDNALWDLKSKLLGIPLVKLLGQVRESVPIYGSGGFTSSSVVQLQQQLGSWSERGIGAVKMKVGREPLADPVRVSAARDSIGQHCELFVDANGAYDRRQAIEQAARFASANVTWFEEPVSSDDLAGLRFIRDHTPSEMRVVAGEYGYDQYYFEQMLVAQAVDVLMADATRCCGITGFLKAAAISDARFVPLSSHCAPSMHLHVACAVRRFTWIEYFHDHARIESTLFDGTVLPRAGELRPDLTRPGHGIELRRADAAKFALG